MRCADALSSKALCLLLLLLPLGNASRDHAGLVEEETDGRLKKVSSHFTSAEGEEFEGTWIFDKISTQDDPLPLVMEKATEWATPISIVREEGKILVKYPDSSSILKNAAVTAEYVADFSNLKYNLDLLQSGKRSTINVMSFIDYEEDSKDGVLKATHNFLHEDSTPIVVYKRSQ
mmetsp:Transcript_22654/g.64288  ORF Transcript_22654/g.64288 Transcript_22654/m.64288 type:complete len:175 (-) Transcript_22654:51-575(-)